MLLRRGYFVGTVWILLFAYISFYWFCHTYWTVPDKAKEANRSTNEVLRHEVLAAYAEQLVVENHVLKLPDICRKELSVSHPTSFSQSCLQKAVAYLHRMDAYKKCLQSFQSSPEREAIHVIIPSNGKRIAGMMALVNSITKNTRNPVEFHLVSDQQGAAQIALWFERSIAVKNVSKEIIVFNSSWINGKFSANSVAKYRIHLLSDPLNFARFFLDRLLPTHKGRVVYLDDDTIVQGDIIELASTPIEENHVAAFASGCNKLMKCVHPRTHTFDAYLNYRKPRIKKTGIPRKTCQFNAGVFVVDLDEFRRRKLSDKLVYWSEMNVREKLFLEGASQPPIMIVFHNLFSELDPRWHVLHLGTMPNLVPKYGEDFLHNEARLLHWDAGHKPWLTPRPIGFDVWQKYSLPDPVKTKEYQNNM